MKGILFHQQFAYLLIQSAAEMTTSGQFCHVRLDHTIHLYGSLVVVVVQCVDSCNDGRTTIEISVDSMSPLEIFFFLSIVCCRTMVLHYFYDIRRVRAICQRGGGLTGGDNKSVVAYHVLLTISAENQDPLELVSCFLAKYIPVDW